MVWQTRKGTLRVSDLQKRWVHPPPFCEDLGGKYLLYSAKITAPLKICKFWRKLKNGLDLAWLLTCDPDNVVHVFQAKTFTCHS